MGYLPKHCIGPSIKPNEYSCGYIYKRTKSLFGSQVNQVSSKKDKTLLGLALYYQVIYSTLKNQFEIGLERGFKIEFKNFYFFKSSLKPVLNRL